MFRVTACADLWYNFLNAAGKTIIFLAVGAIFLVIPPVGIAILLFGCWRVQKLRKEMKGLYKDAFDVYSHVQTDAFYLITPPFMERLQVLAGRYESIAMKVFGNTVVLAFNEPGKNVFDAEIEVGKLDLDKEMAKVQGEIDDIKMFITMILNLRTNV